MAGLYICGPLITQYKTSYMSLFMKIIKHYNQTYYSNATLNRSECIYFIIT